MFANKFPGKFATTYFTPSDSQNSRFTNNSNVLTDSVVEILDTWLNIPFKSPCLASDSKL
ncbi:hypothetical protein DVH24_010779 [Malus domestica]|uniref:Uncharacterized protein n=1 Tax=Malus domestica TaxID=3750 RepID=A0A498JXF0_MALDO|nr:hypothetical protein DVH24_010779 [Malus domestica]